ncbi:basal-body rod modification protein FlgD [bacterium BMS3Bbin12]|nr:basal-body rod modification protein FlgD [bacterium BMS3Abin12]GBE48695.1 basal-body rod modification protein FlgD [bacterium BMS3Bbin12]GBE50928.1 basal-body rod modification protein FlgD [bacterium BMS3Bbin13]HDJ85986.1 flagellar hook assembly protein FlgD [Chromatiales bacterium]HDK03238.1 flagellar hook assembly protein FlgD [Gammaproteobacteria bacterium]
MTPAIDTATLQKLGLLQSPPRTTANDPSKLGQSDFLKLMTTQLQNQDPLQPLDSTQFLSQMAQFGTVSGIDALQKSFGRFSTAFTANQALQAAGLVGRTVLVPQDVGTLSAGGVLQGAAQMPIGAAGGTVKIYDMNGQLVRTLQLDPAVGGLAHFRWNGVEDNGSRAPAGAYQMRAGAGVGGKSTALQTYVAAPVASVILGNSKGGLTLDLEGVGPVALSEVKQIM